MLKKKLEKKVLLFPKGSPFEKGVKHKICIVLGQKIIKNLIFHNHRFLFDMWVYFMNKFAFDTLEGILPLVMGWYVSNASHDCTLRP